MTSKDTQIIQLCDYMNTARQYLKDRDRLDIFLASSLDWEVIVRDKELKSKINKIINNE